MVRAIQAQRASDCNAEIWNPYVHRSLVHLLVERLPWLLPVSPLLSALVHLQTTAHMIGQTDVPSTLRERDFFARRYYDIRWVRKGLLLGNLMVEFCNSHTVRLTARSAGCILHSPTTGISRAKARV